MGLFIMTRPPVVPYGALFADKDPDLLCSIACVPWHAWEVELTMACLRDGALLVRWPPPP